MSDKPDSLDKMRDEYTSQLQRVPVADLVQVATEAWNKCRATMESQNAAKDKRIAELEAALKFYVDTNNWIEIEGTDGCYQQIKDDSYKHSNGYSMGGKLARKALGGGE